MGAIPYNNFSKVPTTAILRPNRFSSALSTSIRLQMYKFADLILTVYRTDLLKLRERIARTMAGQVIRYRRFEYQKVTTGIQLKILSHPGLIATDVIF